jgi:hypothetical protein
MTTTNDNPLIPLTSAFRQIQDLAQGVTGLTETELGVKASAALGKCAVIAAALLESVRVASVLERVGMSGGPVESTERDDETDKLVDYSECPLHVLRGMILDSKQEIWEDEPVLTGIYAIILGLDAGEMQHMAQKHGWEQSDIHRFGRLRRNFGRMFSYEGSSVDLDT